MPSARFKRAAAACHRHAGEMSIAVPHTIKQAAPPSAFIWDSLCRHGCHCCCCDTACKSASRSWRSQAGSRCCRRRKSATRGGATAATTAPPAAAAPLVPSRCQALPQASRLAGRPCRCRLLAAVCGGPHSLESSLASNTRVASADSFCAQPRSATLATGGCRQWPGPALTQWRAARRQTRGWRRRG